MQINKNDLKQIIAKRTTKDIEKIMTELRSCIFIDQLQPQTLAYLASWMRGIFT
ncbi:MAG: hypothetical protein CM15mP109_14790 [Candidatus Dadabacteria bacterium]|nr:MAG: hypothetical protein CM15mP109_14790 [Candidatus Dadabacteria bacterium]